MVWKYWRSNACFNSQNNDYYFRPFNVFSFDILLSPLHSKVFHSLFFQFKVLKVFWTKFFGKIKNVLCCQGYMKILIYFYSITRFRIDKVKPWNGFWKRMDFQLEWIEILNYTISKILTEKMILILNIGMNWKTDLLSQLLGLFCFLGDVGGDLENLERWQG